jgi:hypothetical protein
MRCNDVIRELSMVGDGRDKVSLARHLAECNSCARWAERSAQLDRLWEATRPGDPSPETWNDLWSRVVATIDQPGTLADHDLKGASYLRAMPESSVVPQSSSARHWRGIAALTTIALAQAAALLLAVGLSWNSPIKTFRSPGLTPSADLAKRIEPSLNSVVEAEDGQVPYIRSEGSSVQVIDLSALETPNGEDPWFVFFNLIEPGQMVAMQ